MTIQLYDSSIYISTKQLDEHDITTINQLSIKSVICNRYDNEEITQPKFLETKNLLLVNGIINVIQQPISLQTVTLNDAFELNKNLLIIPKPILLYCRTGTRSIFLMSMINAYNGDNLQTILTKAKNLNYNLQPYRIILENIIKLYKKNKN